MANEGEIIHACRYIKQTSTAISGAVRGVIIPRTVKSVDPGGASDPGPVGSVITKKSVEVQIWGTRAAILTALLGSAAANIVFGCRGPAGALEKITVKNVELTDVLGQIEIPDPDGGGRLTLFGIGGLAQWGSSDTFATMIAGAADA